MSHKQGTYLGGIRSLDDLKKRCIVDELSGCWLWRLSTTQGFPNVHIPHPVTGERTKMKGRRAALILKTGKMLPSGWFAIRKPSCESPICCNPDHSFAGDGKAYGQSIREQEIFKNSPKRIAANRKIASQKTRKLTNQQASEIRQDDRSTIAIAAEYGVSKTTVNDIKRGLRYRQTIRGASIFSMGAA